MTAEQSEQAEDCGAPKGRETLWRTLRAGQAKFVGVSLHLTQLTFMSFAQMIKEARSRLLDEWLTNTS